VRKKSLAIQIVSLSLLALIISVSLVSAAVEVDTSALREAVTVEGVRTHLEEFQEIAKDNDGVRVSGSAGYDTSAAYVRERLENAGYNVTVQPFNFPFFQELTPATVEQTAPDSVSYVYGEDFLTMDYSGSGNVTAPMEAVDLVLPPGPVASTSNSGCEASDFDNFTDGNIALIQRGTCTFAAKAQNAEAAGATAVIIFNEGQPGRTELFGGTLGGPVVTIPVLSASFAFGTALNDLIDEGLKLNIVTDTVSETRSTVNVLAETPGGRADRVVVVGAHLDSVSEGPGIQDNGSGSAAILEIALQMAALELEPRNKVRFAWWGAEEAGLLGSEYYVSQLSARDIKKIALNLNFDMIASPNYVPFVYDGDGSATALSGPNGSKTIEAVFLEYFDEVENLVTQPTAFDGRSDYGPFIAVGIPAGGLFTGAEDLKTEAEAALYGGEAGQPYDSCYHLACDNIDNVDEEALDLMSDAAAHATMTFAMTTSSVNGSDKGKGLGKWRDGMEYQGSHAKK
jgi:Zn-dependent M28 family amino/carboxypeptidase